jgi:hypothetical protein
VHQTGGFLATGGEDRQERQKDTKQESERTYFAPSAPAMSLRVHLRRSRQQRARAGCAAGGENVRAFLMIEAATEALLMQLDMLVLRL